MQMKVFSRLLTQNRIISDIIALFTNIKRIEENLLQLTNLISQYESVESVVLLSLDKKNNVLRKTSVSGNADSNSQWIPELINLSQNKNFYSLIITESLFLSEQIITVENVLSQRYNWIEMNDLLFVPLKLSNSLFGLLIVSIMILPKLMNLTSRSLKQRSLIIALIFKEIVIMIRRKALLEAENANKIKTSFWQIFRKNKNP